MNKILRLTIALVGMVALFAIPDDGNPRWGAMLIASKALAVFCFYAADKLNPKRI